MMQRSKSRGRLILLASPIGTGTRILRFDERCDPPLDRRPKRYGRGDVPLIAEMYPICRSITGNGVRKTLGIIEKHISIEVHIDPRSTGLLVNFKKTKLQDAF